MANEQNLTPNETRTPSERRRNASIAGKASGKARRQKRAIKDCMETLLSLPAAGAYKDLASEFGIGDDDIDNHMLLVTSIFRKAVIEGDVAAFREILKLQGEDKSESDIKEQQARIDKLKAETQNIKGTSEDAENQDDGFIDALTERVDDVWRDD